MVVTYHIATAYRPPKGVILVWLSFLRTNKNSDDLVAVWLVPNSFSLD